MDLGLGPGKRGSIGVVGLDEGIDVLSELFDRGEGSAVQRLSFQDREPDFHLIEPGGPCRREVKTNVRVAPEPAIVPGLVGVEVVENDVNGGVGVSGDDIIHEVEELDAPPTPHWAPAALISSRSQPCSLPIPIWSSACAGGRR